MIPGEIVMNAVRSAITLAPTVEYKDLSPAAGEDNGGIETGRSSSHDNYIPLFHRQLVSKNKAVEKSSRKFAMVSQLTFKNPDMKNLFALVFAICVFSYCQAQLQAKPNCDLVVDILNGTVNRVPPNYTPAQIKRMVPCFTSEEAETPESKCGGAIYYKTNSLTFYTGRDYVEIGQGFKGKMSMPLMGAKRNSLFKLLGNPKLKDAKWDAFQTQYGCLVLYYSAANTVNKIQFSTNGTEVLQLCQ